MTNDLISRQALLEDISHMVFSGRSDIAHAEVRGANKVADRIIAAPAVDAVEVVRCKDCKYAMLLRRPESKLIADCYIRIMYSDDRQFCMVGENDFCSYGEQREENGK